MTVDQATKEIIDLLEDECGPQPPMAARPLLVRSIRLIIELAAKRAAREVEKRQRDELESVANIHGLA